MDDFGSSRYGEMYARALEIGMQHPLTGLGGDGFRYGCPQPRYFRPSFDGKVPDGGGAVICWRHPHNFYAEALADGGFVGLACSARWLVPGSLPLATWCSRCAAIRARCWSGCSPGRHPALADCLSTSAFISMPMGGWFFLLLGWGMAEARWPRAAA